MRIAVIGYGAFGKALSDILLENGHELSFFDPKKFPTMTLDEACDFGSTILYSAPSAALEQTVKDLSKKNREKPFIIACKGLADMRAIEPLSHPHVLSGPSFASDLKKHKKTTLTASSIIVRHIFENSFLKIEVSHDLHGIILCGSLKNIYSIYAGLMNIRPATEKYRTFLLDSVKEFKNILKENDCEPRTANLSCGFHDLAVTAANKKSRNYAFGQALSKAPGIDYLIYNSMKAPKIPKVSLKSDAPLIEGLSALRAMFASDSFFIPEDYETTLPIFATILRVIPNIVK